MSMIPKIDIKNVLGGLPAITNADNVYAELAGNQGKINRNILLGLSHFKNYGNMSGSLDGISSGYGYNDATDGSGLAGMFICVDFNLCRLQIKSAMSGALIKFRGSNFNGEWSAWKSISVTK